MSAARKSNNPSAVTNTEAYRMGMSAVSSQGDDPVPKDKYGLDKVHLTESRRTKESPSLIFLIKM